MASARVELLTFLCLRAREELELLRLHGVCQPSGELFGDVFVPNNRLLAFAMLLGAQGESAADDEAIDRLKESVRSDAAGGTRRRSGLTNRGFKVGAALNRDGRHAAPAKLGPKYLRELAVGLGLDDELQLQLTTINERLRTDTEEPFGGLDVAAEVRRRRDGAYPLRSIRNLADDPPPSGETVDRPDVREQCASHLTQRGRDGRRRPLVLWGPSGNGKTALVSRLIDDEAGGQPVELGVWIQASSRSAILNGFARAATAIQRANPKPTLLRRGDPLSSSNPLVVANTVCELLSALEHPWYVVLDDLDLSDAAVLEGLALPSGRAGHTFITTVWSTVALPRDFAAVRVGSYTTEEALQFLRMRLGPAHESGVLPPDLFENAEELAVALGRQPFSLDQAATTILRESISCAEYLRRLEDRPHGLDDVPVAEQRAAANWLEGLARTSYRPPAGMEERFVLLAALCGPTVPVSFFMTDPALHFLGGEEGLTADDARRGAVRLSTRGLLAFHYSQQEQSAAYLEQGSVRMHDIASRAVLATYAHLVGEAASVAARSLRRMWGEVERNPGQNAQLRTCAQALATRAPEVIWQDADAKQHVSEFIVRSLNSLGETGQYALAASEYDRLASQAVDRFGAHHRATLELRGRAALWRVRAGDIAAAITQIEAVLADYEPYGDTRDLRLRRLFRQELATSHGWAGNTARAVAELDALIEDWAADPQAEETRLGVEYTRALWWGRDGRPRAAFDELERLLPLRLEQMDADRLGILRTRLQIEIWRARTGAAENDLDMVRTAVHQLSRLVADWVRVAGRDHPDTLRSRRHLAVLRIRSGDAAALSDLEDVHAASISLFGWANPDTLRSAKELALAHGRLGAWDVALEQLSTLVTQMDGTRTPVPEQLRIRYDRAVALAELGRRAEALADLVAVSSQQRDVLSEHHPDLLDTEDRVQELVAGEATRKRRPARSSTS